MAITISGENNNDRIVASDGVIDSLSGFNVVGVVTATSFTGDLTGNVTGNVVGNLTGNVNHTSNLLLQVAGSEKFRVASSGQLGIGGANYGTSGQVLTSGGSGSAASWTTISTSLTSDAQFNTVAGTNAGDSFSGTDANNNTLIGYDAGTSITTADYCTALGSTALDALTTGNNNTAVGFDALGQVTTSVQNVAVGAYALRSNTAHRNVATGVSALYSTTSGTMNSSFGHQAGRDITEGDYNTILGANAGNSGTNDLTTGSNNLLIGYNAEASSATVDNEITLGNSSITKFRIPGINFTLKDNGGTPTQGHVLTVDGNGEASFAASSGTTINNNADNRIITGSGSANTLEGEANLTFDGTNLDLPQGKRIRLGNSQESVMRYTGTKLEIHSTASNSQIELESDKNFNFKYVTSGGFHFTGAGQQILSMYGGSGGGIYFRHNNSPKLKLEGGNFTYENGATVTHASHVYIPDSIIHVGDTNTKIRFPSDDKIQFETGGDNRLYINNSAIYVKSGFPLAFLASSGATPNIKSGGTNNQDLLFTTGSGNPTRLQITSGGIVEVNTTGGAATFRVRSGGDIEIYAANNTDKVTLFCDVNNTLTISEKLRFTNTSGGILRSNGNHALKPTGGCIQTKVTYRGSKFTNSSGSYQVVHSHDFTVESGNLIGMHLDCDMNADNSPTSWQMMGLRIGSTLYSEKIIEHGSGQNMNASASGLTGAMSAGNHAVQFVTRNGGGQCSYNEAVNGAGIVLHTYEYVA